MDGKLLLVLPAIIGLTACGGLTFNQCPEFPAAPPELLEPPTTLYLLPTELRQTAPPKR